MRAALVAVVAATVVAGCSAGDPCTQPPSDGDCPDLRFRDLTYDEWRPIELSLLPEELGDGVYPACNDDEPCNGPDLGGFGATDVWLVPGVSPRQAVAGNRQGTEQSVIFVRQGLDPADVPGLAAAAAS